MPKTCNPQLFAVNLGKYDFTSSTFQNIVLECLLFVSMNDLLFLKKIKIKEKQVNRIPYMNLPETFVPQSTSCCHQETKTAKW